MNRDKTGDYLKAQFREADLIYHDVAEYLGVSISFICQIITDNKPIPLHILMKLYLLLDNNKCDMSEFWYYAALLVESLKFWLCRLTGEQAQALVMGMNENEI